jgi:hypothetical protein
LSSYCFGRSIPMEEAYQCTPSIDKHSRKGTMRRTRPEKAGRSLER